MTFKHVAASLLAVAGLALAPSAASAATTDLLFVQETAGGELTRTAAGRYELRLHRVSPRVTNFTDRPSRQAGNESTTAFVSRWASRGFAEDAPNAALVVEGAPRSSDVVLLTLSRPRYDRATRTLTYTARPLKGEPAGSLAEIGKRGDRVSERRFGTASLFIDDAGSSTVYQRITFNVGGAAPGQTISLAARSAGGSIGFSAGPPFQPSSGVQFSSTPGGPIPVSSFALNPSNLTVLTSSEGSGGEVSFTASLYLAASSDTEIFFLTSNSDPGVYVTVQVGNQLPQVVNNTQTIFAWNPR